MTSEDEDDKELASFMDVQKDCTDNFIAPGETVSRGMKRKRLLKSYRYCTCSENPLHWVLERRFIWGLTCLNVCVDKLAVVGGLEFCWFLRLNPCLIVWVFR